MRHLIIFTIALLFTGIVFAQQGTSSPYSFYGMGVGNFKGTAENKAMGGIRMVQDSIHLNILNPASLAELELVNFSIGVGHQYAKIKSQGEKQNGSSSNIEFVAIGIPVGKFAFSFGVLPSSSVGYTMSSLKGNESLVEYSGSGGLNKTFFNLGFKINPSFNIGLEAGYNFGSVKNEGVSLVQDVNYATREKNEFDVNGFNFKFATSYKLKLKNNSYLLSNLTYSPKYKLSTDNNKLIESIMYSGIGDHIIVDQRELEGLKANANMPSELNFGLGYGKEKHWFVGAEYGHREAEEFNTHSLALDNLSFTKANSYRLGGYYIPNYRSFTKILQRSVYRFGMRYEEMGLKINQESIDEIGISFGMGIPMKRYFSNINLGFEFGKRGTTKNNLIQENFVNMSLTLSLNDRWFQKRYIY